jgi:hypothetical protein
MVISELCWFEKNSHAEVRRFLADEGADIEDTAARREAVSASGYRLLGDFALPSSGWWENYYVPLAERLDRFEKEHTGDPDALAVSSRSRHEIDLYRRHPGAFGYVFFVMTLPNPSPGED